MVGRRVQEAGGDRMIDLMEVRRLARQIDERNMRLEFLISKMLPSGIRYDLDRVQTSPEDPMSQFAAAIDETEREIIGLRVQLFQAMKEATDLINQLDSDVQRNVLLMYYVSCANIHEIAKKLKYTPDGIYTIRRRGIKKLHEIESEQ